MGASNIKAENESIVKSNKKMITAISQPIAVVNKPSFKKKLQEKLPADIFVHIKCIDRQKREKAICDEYGRITHFYADLADQRIPVYQPGTIMFECGVVKESKLKVEAHGS
jgi:hypothetical protein